MDMHLNLLNILNFQNFFDPLEADNLWKFKKTKISNMKVLKIFGSSAQKYFETKMFNTLNLSMSFEKLIKVHCNSLVV